MMLNSIRSRLVIYALILAVLSIGTILSASLYNGMKVKEHLNEEYENQQLQGILDYVNSTFSDLETLKSILTNTDFSSYISKNWNLRDPSAADSAKKLLNQKIDELRLSPNVIKKIYMLGNSENQRNFIKNIGDSSWTNAEVPSYYDFFFTTQNVNYFDFLFSDKVGPEFIEKNTLEKSLPETGNSLYKKVYPKFKNLAKELEGNIIMSKISGSFSGYISQSSVGVVIIIINHDFIEDYLSKNGLHNSKITLLDEKNQIIWTNLNLGKDQNPFLLLNSTDNVFTDKIAGIKYTSRYKSLDYSNFKLVYSTRESWLDPEGLNMLAAFSLYLLLAVTAAFLIVFHLSEKITRPFKKLTRMIKDQVQASSVSELEISSSSRKSRKELTIHQRIFYLFVLLIFVSAIISTFLSTRYIYSYTKDKLDKTALTTSANMCNSMTHLMRSYYLYNNLIPFVEIESIFKSSYSPSGLTNKDVENILVTQPLNLSYFANLVLLDSSGYVKYQSIFSNNPQLLNVPATIIKSDFYSQKNDVFWQYTPKGIFNQPEISIVRKIYSSEDISNSEKKPIGYMEMFLHKNPFQAIRTSSKTDFLVFNNNDDLIYSSFLDQKDNYRKIALNILKDSRTNANAAVYPINNIQYIVSHRTLPQDGWHIVIFQNFDAIATLRLQLLVQNIFISCIVILLAFILSLGLSRIVIRPINSIKDSMAMVGKGDFRKLNLYSGSNELSELIHAYNKMVEHINILMQENISQKTREHELVVLKAQAELNMLQQQINPHFLYNSLEMINMQAMVSNEEKISNMASALSKLFRYTTQTDKMTVPLDKELDHARNYIIIQQLRFGDKFTASWDIQTEALKFEVIRFILQPIIENSINHGLFNTTSGGAISISARVADHNLMLEITDNGTGMKSADLKLLRDSFEKNIDENSVDNPYNPRRSNGKSSGIALKNVYKRLKLFYNDRASMQIESEYMQGTRVTITIKTGGSQALICSHEQKK